MQPPEMVLPLVVRIERSDPPTRTDALEAGARAVLFMLTTEDPRWRPAVERWDAHRIRKVVRRARGAQWQATEALEAVTVDGPAEVRVFPPIELDAWPPLLARLQVGGTELTDPEPPTVPRPEVPLVLLAPNVTMSAGKAMAQAGHAAQLGWRSLTAPARAAWQHSGFELAVRTASPDRWTGVIEAGAPIVRDAGFTEIAPGSETATIVFPAGYGV